MSMSLPAAYWCVLIAALLPFVWVGVAKWGTHYNNATPRDLDLYQGHRRRAHDAHQNAFEALEISDFAYVLEVGYSTISGPSKEIAADPRVREAYLGV